MARLRFHRALCIVATAAVVSLAAAPNLASASSTLRTVALTGWHAPGTSSGVTYGKDFGTPVINDAGYTAFRATVNELNNYGLWSEASGSLTLAARRGNQVPGAPIGVSYLNFSALVLNDAGQVAFSATFEGSGVNGTNDSGLLVQRQGGITMVARERDQAAQLPSGAIYRNDFSFSAVLNNAGQTAFSNSILGNGPTLLDNSGIWSEGSGSLALLVRSGDPAMQTSPGVTYTTPTTNRPFESPVLNDAGETAFRAGLTGTGVDSTNNFGIWRGRPANLNLVARAGDEAPGTPAGVTFRGSFFPVNTFGSPALNNAGQIAFGAGLTGSSVDSTNDEGIWSEGSGSLALVARKGNQAPGMPAGVTFGTFRAAPAAPVLNNAGQTAFHAFLNDGGVNGWSIWSEGSGNLAVVAYRGGQAPGTPGVNFAGFDFRSLVLNDAGQVAFVATLMGGGVNDSNDRGIWATDRNGILHLIAREGEMLEVAPGDFRIIYSLDFIGGTGNGDGRPSGFNNRGQLAFHARFTDDSRGIFVSNVVAIPEPNSLLLLALGLVGAYLSQRPTVRTLIPPCSTTGPTQATALAARAKQWSLTPTCRASRLLI